MTVTLTRRQTCTVEIPDDVDDLVAAAIRAAADAEWCDVHDEPVVTAIDPVDDVPHDPFCHCLECEHQAASTADAFDALCVARGS